MPLFPRCLSPWVLGATLVFLPGARLASTDAQWELNGDLESSTGHEPLAELAASPAIDPEFTFETTQINGQDAEVAHFSRGTYFDVPHAMPPNGGGLYVNQFTLIMDVMFPDRTPSAGWASLFQTNCCNGNDGDWFVSPAEPPTNGGVGISGNYGGLIEDGVWYRIAVAVDLVAGTFTSYIDGVQVQQNSGEGLDGRFALYSPTDGDPDLYETFFIFADESGDNAEGFVNSVQFHDLALDASVIAEIGGPSAAGIPADICLFPAAIGTRDIVTTRTPEETNGDYLPGDLLDVEITLANIRGVSPPCPVPAGVVILETLPAGWTPSQISDNGVHDPAGNTITWSVLGAALTEGKQVRYKVTAAATPELGVTFAGTNTESRPGAKGSPTRGDSRLLSEIPFDACGGIRSWNILGPYVQPAGQTGENPGDENIRKDYLTDGSKTELDFQFFPGATVATDFGGTAASTGLFATGQADVNPGGIPTVLAWNDRDSQIGLNDDVYRNNPDQVMSYGQVYLRNTTGGDIECKLGISSDDSIQVLVNGEEVWIHSVARGGSSACAPTDMTPDGFLFVNNVVLQPGENSVIVKTFEGGGGFDFSLVILDPDTGTPITKGLEVRKYPEGVCPIAPVEVTRSIDTGETEKVQHDLFPKWSPGTTYTVALALSNVRGANERPSCPSAAGPVTIRDRVPAGWTPKAPSDGGQVNGQDVSWTVDLTGQGGGGGILNLSYQVDTPAGNGTVSFSGSVSEPGNLVTFAVGGANVFVNPTNFNSEGFITRWLLLGPYRQRSGLGWGAAPSPANMQLDFLTDGLQTENDILPEPGDIVNTVYAPTGASPGLGVSPVACPINPGGVPTWFGWLDLDDTINHNDYYCSDINLIMMYAFTYVSVESDIAVDIGLDSDDAVQVLLDGDEIWLNSIARAPAGPNTVVDTILASQTPALNPLPAGCHTIMVKVFEGGGDHQFRLRFQDPATFLPIGEADGLVVFSDPSCFVRFESNCTNGLDDDNDGATDCLDADCAGQPACPRLVRGDSNADGRINITDPIYSLAFSFQGGPPPPCRDAADADDAFGINITDPIYLLSFLFQGGPRPPAPSPSSGNYVPGDCGLDTTADNLDCLSFPPCN